MRRRDEDKLGRELRKLLEVKGCKTEKLHGGPYQQGLPDVLVKLPRGTIILVETKWGRPESIGETMSMLQRRQPQFFLTWKDAPVFILVGRPPYSGEHTDVALVLAEELTSAQFNDKLKYKMLTVTVEELLEYDTP